MPKTIKIASILATVSFTIPTTVEELVAAYPETERNTLIEQALEQAFSNLIYRSASGLPTVRTAQANFCESEFGIKRQLVYRTNKDGTVKTDDEGDPLVDVTASESEDTFVKRVMAEVTSAGLLTEEEFVKKVSAACQAVVDDPENRLSFTNRRVRKDVGAKLSKKWIEHAENFDKAGKLAAVSARLVTLGYANDGTINGVASALQAKSKADAAKELAALGES